MGERVGVGVVGCGSISGVYLRNLADSPVCRVVAVADRDPARAEARAGEFGAACAGVGDLLDDDAVHVILNLTTPDAHAEIALAAVAAGKHVYNEKPLTIRRRDARRLLASAEARGLLVGAAPDTFLGGGIATCQRLIESGAIGTPVAATAFMMCHGHESWHPDPAFYYARGGGPLFDMGPYYLTALVHLLGPVARVTGMARATFPTRTITSAAYLSRADAASRGPSIAVETPTHVAGTLEFDSGAIGTLIMSFDVWHHSLPHLEIHGSEGSMQCPDPNTFGGPVRVRGGGDRERRDVPITSGRTDNARGIGVEDLCRCVLEKREEPAASGRLAYHVLDVMHSMLDAAECGERVEVESRP